MIFVDYSLPKSVLYLRLERTEREYSVEELKNALIERCEKEGILYATVAMDRRTKEMILPDTLEGALKHPEYFVCTCRRVKDQYIVEEITKV